MHGVILVVFCVCLLLAPAAAFAQASLAGVVRDTSGAVLPGVTVVATSPALIEKVRESVTDGTGQYRIENLRPGTYAVTFTLPGFGTVRREGIVLTGSFTATINAELRVASVEETITVSGDTPIVDVQNTLQQRVIDHEVADVIPTGRLPYNLAVLIPGVSVGAGFNTSGMGLQDVGGATGDQILKMVVHGSRPLEQRILLNGLPTGMVDQPSQSVYTANLNATQEMTVDTASLSAESAYGGVRFNVIPKDGGNTLAGVVFGSFASEALASTNLTDELRASGLTIANSIKTNGELNPGFGGPLRRDKVWFYLAARYQVINNYAAGMFEDRTANDPNVWTFNPDTSRPAVNHLRWADAQGRATLQATPIHKLGFSYTHQDQCKCPNSFGPSLASPQWNLWSYHGITADWSAPVTNRVLFEAALYSDWMRWGQGMPPDLNLRNVPVTEQSTGLLYKARNTYNAFRPEKTYYRAAVSYVTGAHSLKVGFANGSGSRENTQFTSNRELPVNYRFNNGVPNRITLHARPFQDLWELDAELGVYAQDRWTIDRLTLTGGVRFDYYKTHFAAQHLGPAPLVPTRDIAIPDTPHLNWKDVTPRMGAVYDLFGDGKTAIKGSLNKYLFGEETSETYGNPVANLVVSTFRSWNDANRNFFPDCDLINPLSNGECGAMADPNFGKSVPGTTYDPEVLQGWGTRGYNWEFSAGVQHELRTGVSVDVGYFRRWYGNFTTTDNRALDAADFDAFSITAPAHPDLPGGGGNTISGIYDLKPGSFGRPANNLVTFSDHYGKQIEHWNGVDFSINTRFAQGILLQGGLATGRTSTDNCEVRAKLPELAPATPLDHCAVDTDFLTQVKLLGSYEIPRVAVRFSATFQSVNGPAVAANYNVPSAVAAQSLGRPLAGGAANVTVNLVKPGTMYGERLNQLDLRFSKTLRVGRTTANLNLDLYNALNANPVTVQSNDFAIWQRPQGILAPRFAKVSAQLAF